MIKSDIKDLTFGIVLILVGIFTIIWYNNEFLKYKNAEEHYKVKAKLVSIENEQRDYNENDIYWATWQYTVKDVNYTVLTCEDYIPASSRTLYVYKDKNGDMVTSASKGPIDRIKYNVLGIVIITGGIVYIVDSIRRTRLRNKRIKPQS